MSDRPPVHAVARQLEGMFTWALPFCWDADQRQRGGGGPTDDELWWLSVDHGAIDPREVLVATTSEAVTCRDCLEWMHG